MSELLIKAYPHTASWLISFGHVSPPADARRQESPEQCYEVRPRTEQDKSDDFFKSRIVKKLRRGIICCVKSGINNNSEIFRILNERGFSFRPKTKTYYSISAFRQYTSYVRRKYKIPANEKKNLILQDLRAGKDCKYICENHHTSRKYVMEVADNHGIHVPKIKQKYNPPSWSKEGLKKLKLKDENNGKSE